MNINLMPWKVSLFPGMTSILPTEASVKSVEHIDRIFKTPVERDPTFEKKLLPCWSPTIYPPNHKRSNSHVLGITALVYDFDHAERPPKEVSQDLRNKGLSFILHTTWSHRPSEPRYRIILFLSRILTPKEYPYAWENGLRLMGYYAGVDRQARNISRHYALPAKCRGQEYYSAIFLEGATLDSDKVSAKPEKKVDRTPVLKRDTKILVDDGDEVTIDGILSLGSGKYKCTCPFQEDASAGSAFVRITKNGRVFLQCTSERHTHGGSQFWLNEKKKGASRSVADRKDKLGELPSDILEYAEKRIAYNALQGVFYRHADGAWQIGTPMRKETLTDHFIGLLRNGCDKSHALAMVDHILSRQIYGFDCQATRDRIVKQNEVPMMNLYAWPNIEPKAGQWDRIAEIMEMLCDGDGDARRWLLHWSAALVQHPERRAMVAVLVLSQQQGIGKSMYGRILSEIIGRQNAVVVSNRALRDNFNSHYVTSLLVLADEVGIDRSAQDVIAEIKACITDDRIHCSTPYAARTTVMNRMTWWMTSNRRRPFVVEKDDRRFTILSPGRAPKKYRMMLRKCFDPKTSKPNPSFSSEISAFSDELLNMEVDWDLIARPFTSETKSRLQAASLGSIDAFVSELVSAGPVEMLADYPPPVNYFQIADSIAAKAVPCETLYGCYREWCNKKGRTDVRSDTILRLAIRDIEGSSVRSARLSGRKMDVYVGIPAPVRQKAGKVVPIAHG